MTVVENLMVALDFAARHAVFETAAHRREAALAILSRIGLAAKADAATTTLTQVELRKMELARALAARPKLLISDEAMAGLSGAEVDGATHDLTKLPPEAIVDLGVALVPEGRRLFPKLTVEENLMLGAFRKAARGAIARNLALAFETFPVLQERASQLAGTLSGGQ